MATNIIADLRTMIGADQLEVVAEVGPSPATFLAEYEGNDAVLFSPRVWGELTPALREDPRAIQAHYVFDSRELDRVADEFEWLRRVPSQSRPRKSAKFSSVSGTSRT